MSTNNMDSGLDTLEHYILAFFEIPYAPLILVVAVVASVILAGLAATWAHDRSRLPPKQVPQAVDEKQKQRVWGQWQPSSYRRPRAPPYPDFDIHRTKPLPYRPFRYGPNYAVNLGIRNMRMEDWIELDNEFFKFHDAKLERIQERGERLCRTAPEARPAALELVEELAAYLPERYPTVFESLADGRRGMRNVHTDEVFDLDEGPRKEDPMQMAARMVQDDIAVMVEKEDGQYYLLAGAIHLAGAWRLEDKFGMPLSEIHTSGDVPQYRERLEKSMMNLFRRIKPDAPVLRNNYFIQMNGNLPWNTSLGPEDEHGQRTKNWGGSVPATSADQLWYRSERQSLRRLPKTGAVVFTIRVYFHPVAEIAQEPYVPGRLASGIRSWGDDVAKYKGREGYEKILLEYLDRKHEEQVAGGLDLSKEEQIRSYPW